jgi:hypothetical protein
VQFGTGQVVLARNRQLGLRQGGVVHLQADSRALQLGALGDQALEHLLAQRGGGGGTMPRSPISRRARAVRARTSLLVMGSVLTTATM